MATLSTQVVALSGLAPTYGAATAGGDKMECGERNFLHIKNGGGASITVTLDATAAVRGQSVADLAVIVPASGERMIGPVTADLFQSPTDGLCAIAYTGVTTVTVASVRI
jgi:hypothetical protein